VSSFMFSMAQFGRIPGLSDLTGFCAVCAESPNFSVSQVTTQFGWIRGLFGLTGFCTVWLDSQTVWSHRFPWLTGFRVYLSSLVVRI
jgi:hypothetical protein